MKTETVLRTLTHEVNKQITDVQYFTQLSEDKLQKKLAPEKWNALECFEHLNGYARHYLPAFEKAMGIAIQQKSVAQTEVRSTWLGRKCIQAVVVSNTKKIKTPKRHHHVQKNISVTVINDFLLHQQRLLQLLQMAATCNLNKTKVAIEIMPLLKLNLGEFLQFFIYHQSRHLLQAKEATN